MPTPIIKPAVTQYLTDLGGEPSSLVRSLERYAAKRSFPAVGRLSGRWLTLLAQMIGAKRVFEAGSGFGYSAAFFAEAVGADGRVIGVEKDQWEIDAFERIYRTHEYKNRITIHNGDAIEVLDSLTGAFDIVFIDANKRDYIRILEAAIPRVRVGGLIIADNVLWKGRVCGPVDKDDEATAAVAAYNRVVHEHNLLDTAVIPVGDGLCVSRRTK